MMPPGSFWGREEEEEAARRGRDNNVRVKNQGIIIIILPHDDLSQTLLVNSARLYP